MAVPAGVATEIAQNWYWRDLVFTCELVALVVAANELLNVALSLGAISKFVR